MMHDAPESFYEFEHQLTEGRPVTVGGQARYRYDIAEAARALWRQEINAGQFYGQMVVIIQDGLWRAWLQGAAQVGVTEEELTDEERIRAQEYVHEQLAYVPAFGEWLVWAGTEVVDPDRPAVLLPRAPMTAVLHRCDLWSNIYTQVLSEARLMADRNGKSKWIYGDTILHCSSCEMLNGRVYRNSTWERYGIRPGSRRLECKGYQCKCTLAPTTERITPGRPPALPGLGEVGEQGFNPNRDEAGRFASGPGGGGEGKGLNQLGRATPIMQIVPKTPQTILRENAISIVDNKTESAFVLGADGEIILRKEGAQSSVDFTPDEISRFEGAALLHNHPSGVSLALTDVSFGINAKLSEIQAVGNYEGTRYLYRMVMDPKTRDSRYSGFWGGPIADMRTIEANLRSELTNKVRRREITVVEADREHFHTVWQKWTEKMRQDGFQFTYTREVL